MVLPTPLAQDEPDDDASPTSPAHEGDSKIMPDNATPQDEDNGDDDSADAVSELPLRSTRSPVRAEVHSPLRKRRALNASVNAASPSIPSPLNTNTSPPPQRPTRRSSSFASNTSAASSRPSVRSADSWVAPGAPTTQEELHSDHELTLWHSAPLLLALVPAVGGVAFKKGSVLVTDLALLCMAAVYLNWCLVTPWGWYREARSIKVVDGNEEAVADDLNEAAQEAIGDDDDDGATTAAGDKEQPAKRAQDISSASHELALHELSALFCCFLGPLVGAYILHWIRTSLSSFGDELVSNMHLTLFVLGAELRPIRHAVKLVQARTLYLQRIVRADQARGASTLRGLSTAVAGEQLSDLQARLDELERAMADSTAGTTTTARAGKIPASFPDDGSSSSPDAPPPATVETVKKAQSALQTQIDALNRAVRRYEKRATAQTLQTEATLTGLETRLKDALALAAAAASYSQKPGVLGAAAEWAGRALRVPFVAVYRAVMVPLGFVARVLVKGLERLGFVRKYERRRVVRKSGGGAGLTARSLKERERLERLVAGGAGVSGRAYR